MQPMRHAPTVNMFESMRKTSAVGSLDDRRVKPTMLRGGGAHQMRLAGARMATLTWPAAHKQAKPKLPRARAAVWRGSAHTHTPQHQRKHRHMGQGTAGTHSENRMTTCW